MALGFQYGAFQSVGFQDEPSVAAPVVGVVPAGRKRQRRWVLDVEGRDLVFATVEALLAFLSARADGLVKVATVKGKSDAQRILQIGSSKVSIKPPRVPFAAAAPDVEDYIKQVEARVERAYSNALMAALAHDAEEIEDLMFIATIQ
jgi:hypothetical protein